MADKKPESTPVAPERRKRPTAPPPSQPGDGWFLVHDGLVIVVAILLLFGGWLAYGNMTAPRQTTFSRQGLTFAYPAGWFPSDPEPEAFPVNVSFSSVDDASIRLEARITKKPPFDGPMESVLDLARSSKHGELYKKLATATTTVGGREWLRSEYVYAYKLSEDDAPQLAHAVEYAAVNTEHLVVVTVHAPDAKVAELERDILGTVSLK